MTTGKVIAVTGASRGIGSAIVEELARRGHTVGCLSRKGVGPEDREVGGELIHLTCDMEIESQITEALGALAERAGRIDGLVNNAGLHQEGRSQNFKTADFEKILTTNVTGTFIACREAYPHLVANGGGLIVNIGSFYEILGARYNLAYSCSKAAMGALTRVLSVEWAEQKIRLIDVAPGYVVTDLNRDYMARESFRDFVRQRVPIGEPCEPEEVARLVATLYAEDLPHLTGETIVLDGAQNINQ
ncbi:MAG: SDR family oxidoreductase [Alphaproteobacteria bacterium]|jgi:NAD(P)-dependent dehydrogenase (short-subunit alcohol dehydrogenase family)|nr:SDR family oxidoreductase [Alphaproteobacteria bacterium]MDP6564782.1 SDR family oxidoreductase [Alphaproteobacteria bacterium]MDP6815880.1 SDR family oxidoreductase [Alphaproteobacteria bacterium]